MFFFFLHIGWGGGGVSERFKVRQILKRPQSSPEPVRELIDLQFTDEWSKQSDETNEIMNKHIKSKGKTG